METNTEQKLREIRPQYWPTEPAYFREFTVEALGKQLAFYQRSYGAYDRSMLGERVTAHLDYLEKALEIAKSDNKSGFVIRPQEKYAQLLSDLEI
jgi:hypothetical protein